MSATGLERLRALLRDGGGVTASLLASPAEPAGGAPPRGARSRGAAGSGSFAASPAALAASGPHASGRRDQYELLVEAIYEGYLLHYGTPRVVRVPEADMRLLVGDRLYAIGLAQLVELGDTHAVAELADTITLSALAQGARRVELADAVWSAGARAVGWGTDAEHARAKQLVLAGDPGALEAMRTSARMTSAPS
ncbi:MAG TPA: hypothetical protein VMF09_01795 [Solirubrobacteraceae bacterium]|nr:hypothetical protein [Solirubrobacteraceae bacterium]